MRHLALLLSVMGIYVAAGCASANRLSYQAVGITTTSVTTGMKAWGDYVRTKGTVPIVEQRQVKAAYDKYVASVNAARVGVVAFTQSNDTNQLDRVVIAVSASASEVLGLLEKLLPADQVIKLKP